jgi:hypothetical protein
MTQYFDLEYQPLASNEGLQDYRSVRSEDGVEIAETYLGGKLAFVVYQGISTAELPAFHLARYSDTDFQLQDGDVQHFYAGDGKFTYKKRQSHPHPDLLLEEEYDAGDQLIGGTAFLLKDDDIRYAVEFNGDRHYFNCYDFESGDSVPVETVRHLLP